VFTLKWNRYAYTLGVCINSDFNVCLCVCERERGKKDIYIYIEREREVQDLKIGLVCGNLGLFCGKDLCHGSILQVCVHAE